MLRAQRAEPRLQKLLVVFSTCPSQHSDARSSIQLKDERRVAVITFVVTRQLFNLGLYASSVSCVVLRHTSSKLASSKSLQSLTHGDIVVHHNN